MVTCVLGIVTTVLYIGVLLTGSETVMILVGKQAVQNTVTRAMEVNLIFIRKVIICEPPFEAVQLNIQYL